MNINGAQITILVLMILNVGINLAKHGEPREGIGAEYNFIVALVSASITVLILWWGGFWK